MPQGSPSVRSGNFPVDILNANSPNESRSSAKGRRRRAAAEQRRAEQERWNELNEDGDDEVESYVMSRSLNSQSRRRNRRSQRRSAMYNDYDAGEDYIPSRQTPSRLTFSEGADLEMALAISLSLSESNGTHLSGAELVGGSDMDMSYENLVMLENVPCVLPSEVVDSLPVTKFCEECDNQIVCTICQTEFVEGDQIMNLTCTHSFHNECAREWFLNYSKKCPICKCDVMQVSTEK